MCICVAFFTDTQSSCVLVCLCVATEASGLYLYFVLCLPLELLFIYYKATILWRCCERLQSINNPESVTPSKQQYLLNSAHTHTTTNWKEIVSFELFDSVDASSYFVSPSYYQAVAGSRTNFFFTSISSSLSLLRNLKISVRNHWGSMWIQSTKVYRTSNRLTCSLESSHFDRTATIFFSIESLPNRQTNDITNLPALQCSSL